MSRKKLLTPRTHKISRSEKSALGATLWCFGSGFPPFVCRLPPRIQGKAPEDWRTPKAGPTFIELSRLNSYVMQIEQEIRKNRRTYRALPGAE